MSNVGKQLENDVNDELPVEKTQGRTDIIHAPDAQSQSTRMSATGNLICQTRAF